jgi:hypothetical protein
MTATCPVCGTETKQRVGVVIGGAWRYCWLCERCGERWGWVSDHEDTALSELEHEFELEMMAEAKGER